MKCVTAEKNMGTKHCAHIKAKDRSQVIDTAGIYRKSLLLAVTLWVNS